MIRTAAQVTQAGKLSARYHREVFDHDGREFRFVSMAPCPAQLGGDPTTRWLFDGCRFLLVKGTGGKREVLPREGFPSRATDGYPLNADTALDASAWTLGKDDPDPRTGEAQFYGEAVEDGGWWRFWALAPLRHHGNRGKNLRWFTNGRAFRLASGEAGKPILHYHIYGGDPGSATGG